MASHADCVFCKIVAGQIPANVVSHTRTGLAFLDIGPLAEGHLLLIPREHYSRLEEMPADLAADLAAQLPALGKVLVQITEARGYNVLQNNGLAAGQVVNHVHFHLIPRRPDDGLGYRWLPKSYPPGRAEELCDQFRRALGT